MSPFLDGGVGLDPTLANALVPGPESVVHSSGPVVPCVTPKVSFSTLARASGPISPKELARLLHGHKHAAAGPRRSYQCALKQVVDSLADHVPLDPNAPLRKHEREAVQAYARMPLRVSDWVRRQRPVRRMEPWL